MPSGHVQRRKCPLMAVCEDKKTPVAKYFGHLVKDAVRFQEASPELHRKYANLEQPRDETRHILERGVQEYQ